MPYCKKEGQNKELLWGKSTKRKIKKRGKATVTKVQICGSWCSICVVVYRVRYKKAFRKMKEFGKKLRESKEFSKSFKKCREEYVWRRAGGASRVKVLNTKVKATSSSNVDLLEPKQPCGP